MWRFLHIPCTATVVQLGEFLFVAATFMLMFRLLF